MVRSQPEFDQRSDRRQPGCETRTGTHPATPERDGQRDAPEGPGRSPGRAQSIDMESELEVGSRPARQRGGVPCRHPRRHGAGGGAARQAPAQRALRAGTDRPRSGPATSVGESARTRQRPRRRRRHDPMARPATSPAPCLDPPLPADRSEQRQVQGAESRSPAETHERERGGAPAPSREARAGMPYGLPITSVFPLTNYSFIAPRPRPTSPSHRRHHPTSTPVTPPLPWPTRTT